ncbi:hypothetical protein [Glaciibacter superstes]|uniref:hypothetical protein n=1 Tax=Glaciibacter superstes TaxID=501023 RepID=UPI0003B4E8D8|nr:hypothetical protein [Glaciibacter superstes]
MTADATPGAKNQPQFLVGGAPDIGVDENIVADYAAKVGNRRTGTTTERLAATGKDVWEGLLWGDTTDELEYKRTGGAWIPLFGSAFAVHSTAQALITGSGTTLVWNGLYLDGGITHSAGIFEVPRAGWYRLSGWMDNIPGGGTDRWLYATKNSIDAANTVAGATTTNSLSGSGLWNFAVPVLLAAGDDVRLNVLQNSGATQNLVKATFGIEWLRAA